jgi:predicted PurR-regulated permease PerM
MIDGANIVGLFKKSRFICIFYCASFNHRVIAARTSYIIHQFSFNMNGIANTTIRQMFFIVIIIGLGGLIFWQLKNFIPAFLGAYTLYVLLRKWFFQLTIKLKGRASLAAILLMIGSFIVILLPINGLIGILTSRILPAIKQPNELWASAELMIHNLEKRYGLEVLTQQNLRNLGEWGVNEIQGVVGATFNGLIMVVVMYFILFFMFTEAKNLEKNLHKWWPLKPENATFLKKQLNNLVVSNAIGIPLVALLQGIVALIGYWIAGVDEPFLWFIATCVAAVIPILGAALVYVPLAIILLAQNHTWQGVFLFLFGFIIIGSVDNLFRFWLQKRMGNVHPLITIFGVIIGLNIFGFMGLIFGPILLSLFLLLMDIYNKEFGTNSVIV